VRRVIKFASFRTERLYCNLNPSLAHDDKITFRISSLAFLSLAWQYIYIFKYRGKMSEKIVTIKMMEMKKKSDER
jgi:hypothetical protein